MSKALLLELPAVASTKGHNVEKSTDNREILCNRSVIVWITKVTVTKVGSKEGKADKGGSSASDAVAKDERETTKHLHSNDEPVCESWEGDPDRIKVSANHLRTGHKHAVPGIEEEKTNKTASDNNAVTLEQVAVFRLKHHHKNKLCI